MVFYREDSRSTISPPPLWIIEVLLIFQNGHQNHNFRLFSLKNHMFSPKTCQSISRLPLNSPFSPLTTKSIGLPIHMKILKVKFLNSIKILKYSYLSHSRTSWNYKLFLQLIRLFQYTVIQVNCIVPTQIEPRSRPSRNPFAEDGKFHCDINF